jgi:hypothetical protein
LLGVAPPPSKKPLAVAMKREGLLIPIPSLDGWKLCQAGLALKLIGLGCVTESHETDILA